MDKMWKFAKRHRGKLIVVGVVSAVSAGGLYLVIILHWVHLAILVKTFHNQTDFRNGSHPISL